MRASPVWFRKLRLHNDSLARGRVATATRRSQKFGPRAVEALEDRALMSQIGHHFPRLPQPHPFTRHYTETNLVSDGAVPAPVTDMNLVNPWGIVAGTATPTPWWVNDNGAGVATLYSISTTSTGPPASKVGLTVQIPLPQGKTPPPASAPTGIVFVDFARSFIFATEDGTISAWNSSRGTNAVRVVDNSATGAVYKGLALASTGGNSYLYATNFRAGTIDVFDSSFHQVTLGSTPITGTFTDPHIPAGFAPFGIANIGGNLYVTYAKQDAVKHDDVAAVGNGFVDVYAPNGTLLQRVAAHGTLDSPWGLAVAPAGFGRFSGALLVGNFGNSRINAFDLKHGTFLGQLTGTNGKPLVLNGGFQSQKGLWGIAFGNGVAAGSNNTLFFASGINDETDGLFGSV